MGTNAKIHTGRHIHAHTYTFTHSHIYTHCLYAVFISEILSQGIARSGAINKLLAQDVT